MLCSSCWIYFRVAVVCCIHIVRFVSELQSYVVFKLMDLFQSCSRMLSSSLMDLFQSCSRMLSSSCWICFRVAVVCCLQVVGFVSELQSYVVFKLLDLF